jgi:glycolate oxidase
MAEGSSRENTTGIPMPAGDPAILARRQEILVGLSSLVSPEGLIASEDERRAYETDALTEIKG